mgnify:FL=1
MIIAVLYTIERGYVTKLHKLGNNELINLKRLAQRFQVLRPRDNLYSAFTSLNHGHPRIFFVIDGFVTYNNLSAFEIINYFATHNVDKKNKFTKATLSRSKETYHHKLQLSPRPRSRFRIYSYNETGRRKYLSILTKTRKKNGL